MSEPPVLTRPEPRPEARREARPEPAPVPAAPSPPAQVPAPQTRLDDPVEVADAEAPATPAAPAPPRGWAPPRSGLRMTLVFVVLALAGALLVLYAWELPPFHATLQDTDNAYVRGQTTVIAPQVSGYVREVLVQDYQDVQAGALIARIDDRVYRERVAQAQAGLAAQQATLANSAQSRRSGEAGVRSQQAAVANAEAQLLRAQVDLRRTEDLAREHAVSLRERDQALATLRQAEAAAAQARAQRTIAEEQVRTVTVGRAGLEAAVASARAALELAQIDLANTEIRAPRDGRLGEVAVRLGQYVTAGTQLVSLVPPTLWVVANYKEGQTARMAPGQPAWVTVDGLAGARLQGRVERLAPATGNEFAVIKSDNATGNFVKVAQRISVRIALDPGQPLLARLRPGMSVQAHVDTAAAAR